MAAPPIQRHLAVADWQHLLDHVQCVIKDCPGELQPQEYSAGWVGYSCGYSIRLTVYCSVHRCNFEVRMYGVPQEWINEGILVPDLIPRRVITYWPG